LVPASFTAGLIGSWPRLSRSEYVALVTIIVITVKLGFIWGIVIGTVIGCATFAVSASRVDSIKFEFDGSELRSSLDRAPADLMVLAAHGREILGLNLQSYLFFGSANRLYRHVKTRLSANPRCRYLLFDFRLVTGIDSSATYSFVQIRNYAAQRGIRLVFVHLPVSVEKALRAETGLLKDTQLLPDLDHALEWCENEVIRTHRAAAEEEGDLRAWFAEVLGDADRADELLRHCSRIEVAPGTVIVRAGEQARSMYFILEGRIGVMVETGEQRSTRVRSLGRHTMVGEMGLLACQPRSATLKAETASVLYQLDAEAFHQLKTNEPQLVERLLSYVVTVLAERLAFANRSIGVLRR
jgi:SulP family sulfate permease